MKKNGLLSLYLILLSLTITMIAGCGGGKSSEDSASTVSAADEINAKIAEEQAEWQAGDTEISVLSDEVKFKLAGFIAPTTAVKRSAPKTLYAASSLPAYLDWRSNSGDFLTPIKDQGDCGSCVAHAALAVVESAIKINGNSATATPDLSESDLFSCGGAKCSEGWTFDDAAGRLQSTGVVDEACLPYQDSDNACSLRCSDWQSRLTKISGWSYLPESDKTAMKSALVSGPIMAAIDVYEDFYYYTSGVYSHVSGKYVGGHAITIVGYDDANSAWIIKNSWGTGWGDKGYGKIRYGQVNIEEYPLYMTVSSVTTAPTVTTSVSPTTIDLASSKTATVSCATTGTVTTTETRCSSTSSWVTSSSGSAICTYSSTGSYTPACRINGSITDDANTPVTVTDSSSTTTRITASVTPAKGTTATTFKLSCSASGGTISKLEGKCATANSWSDITSAKTLNCTYSAAGTYTPSCRANNTTTANASSVTVTAATTGTATVTPTSGTTLDSFKTTCTPSVSNAKIEGRCAASSKWGAVSGTSFTCKYSAAGTYTSACRFGGSTVANAPAVTITKPILAATVTPTSGTVNDTYILTCKPSGFTPSSLEGRCGASYKWGKTSDSSLTCKYSAGGKYTPSCRANGSLQTDASTVTVKSATTVKATMNPSSGATSTKYKLTCAVSGGTAKTLEARCKSSSSWQTLPRGATGGTCAYNIKGTFTPGCRVDSTTVSETTVTVK